MIAPFLLPVALKVVHALHAVRRASQRAAAPERIVVQISTSR